MPLHVSSTMCSSSGGQQNIKKSIGNEQVLFLRIVMNVLILFNDSVALEVNEWMIMEHRWNDSDWGKTEVLEERNGTVPRCIL